MILTYLRENLISEDKYLPEARFGLVAPENFQFYGIESLETLETEDDRVLSQCIGPYIFAFNENLFDVDLKTTLLYPQIQTESGGIRYDVYGDKIKPMYVDSEGLEYDLTDMIIKKNPDIQEFLNGIAPQLIVDVSLDVNFDLSESDPSFDPDKSLETLNNSSPAEVFRKINNVAYIMKDYLNNFDKYVVNKVVAKVFGAKYKLLTSNFKYNLKHIIFNGKEDFEGDMKRTNIYKKWFEVVGPEMGNVVQMDVDGIDFDTTYSNTKIA